jgi:5'-3' exonuclease
MGVPIKQFILNTLNTLKDAEGINTRHLETYCCKCVAVDITSYLYLSLATGNITEGIFNLISKLRGYGIIILVVFDGYPPDTKFTVINKRRRYRNRASDKIIELKLQKEILIRKRDEKIDSGYLSSSFDSIQSNNEHDFDFDNKDTDDCCDNFDLIEINSTIEKLDIEIKKYEKRAVSIKIEHIIEIKELLNLLNIQYVHMEEYEADVVCSALAKYKLVDAVLSNDMDMLAYGCPIILRDFTFKKDTITEYNTSKIIKNLDLDTNQFIDFCIILGNDYNSRLCNYCDDDDIYKLIKKYDNIENIINYMEKQQISYNKQCKYENTRQIYNMIIPYKNIYIRNVLPQFHYNKEKISKYLVPKCPRLKLGLILRKISTIMMHIKQKPLEFTRRDDNKRYSI